MFRTIVFFTVVLTAQIAFGQSANSVTITVKNHDTKENISEATVTLKDSEITGVTDKTAARRLAAFLTAIRLSKYLRSDTTELN